MVGHTAPPPPPSQTSDGDGHQSLTRHQFPQLLLGSREDYFLRLQLSVHWERYRKTLKLSGGHNRSHSPWTSWLATQWWGCTRSSQAGHFIRYLHHRQHPQAPASPRCPLQSQRGCECFQSSDKLNLPDSLDLPLVLHDAFTSSWLRQRQTCFGTFAVSQSHFPLCDLLLPVFVVHYAICALTNPF